MPPATKPFGSATTGGAVSSFPSQPEIKETPVLKAGAAGMETAAEFKVLYENLNKVIKAGKELGLWE